MTERLRLDHPPISIEIRRTRRAQRLTLSVPQTGGAPRLTAPAHVTMAEIRRFLSRQSAWLEGAVARAPEAIEVTPGAMLPVAGTAMEIRHQPGPRRPPLAQGGALILQGGRPADAGPRIRAWLIERARGELARIAHDCAAELGATPGKVTMRDTKSRWGSCSSRGDLNFSWRLAMAPPAVLDYVAAHEAAHLREMNHGPRFWALVERLRPDWRTQREWLRREGAALHLYRFSQDMEDAS